MYKITAIGDSVMSNGVVYNVKSRTFTDEEFKNIRSGVYLTGKVQVPNDIEIVT